MCRASPKGRGPRLEKNQNRSKWKWVFLNTYFESKKKVFWKTIMCQVFSQTCPVQEWRPGPVTGYMLPPTEMFLLGMFEYIIFIYLIYFIWLPPTEKAKYDVNIGGTMQGEGRCGGEEQGKLLMCEWSFSNGVLVLPPSYRTCGATLSLQGKSRSKL